MSDSTEKKSQDVVLAGEILQAFLKAKKNLRIYPSNNPIYKKTIEEVHKKFGDLFEFRDSLELRIARNEILFEGEPVFQGDGRDDNLALFFFRDGLREITFADELTMEELKGFLEIVSVDFDREDVEDDIVTLLWESDFPHISYKVDEAVLVEDESYEEEATEQARTGAMKEDSIRRVYEDAFKQEETSKIEVIPVAEDDLKALFREVERDSEDKKSKFIDIIFDIVHLSETSEEYKDLARILNSTIEYSVRSGDLKSVVDIFKKTKSAIRNNGSEDIRKGMGIVLSYAGTSNLINVIGEKLDAGTEFDEAVFSEYVGYLGTTAIPPFIALLGELQTISARKFAINALAVLGKKDISGLIKGLRDSRWYLVRNIVYILGKIGDKRASEHIIKVMNHEDVRVRREALRTLGIIGGEGAAQTIKSSLSDPDPTVRIAAAKSLGSIGTELTKRLIFEHISDKKFLNAEFDEMKGFFEVLSIWKDDLTVGFLMDVLKRNPLFKRSKYNEMRASAAYCLGLMGSKEFLEVLEKLRDEKSQVVSEHANAAIKRISYGR